MRIMDPKLAMDFPRIEPDKFIIWYSNGYRWPDGRRNVAYLSDKRTAVRGGFALFSDWEGAATFDNEADARAWREANEAKRPHRYGALNITTVAELIRDQFNDGQPINQK